MLYYMRQLTPNDRKADMVNADIVNSVEKYAEAAVEYYKRHKDKLFSLHPHSVLAAVGTFGLLQKFLPEKFPDDRNWSDIFSDRRLYQTKAAEIFQSGRMKGKTGFPLRGSGFAVSNIQTQGILC